MVLEEKVMGFWSSIGNAIDWWLVPDQQFPVAPTPCPDCKGGDITSSQTMARTCTYGRENPEYGRSGGDPPCQMNYGYG